MFYCRSRECLSTAAWNEPIAGVGWYWDPLYCCMKWAYCRSGVRLRPFILLREVVLLQEWGETEALYTAAWSGPIAGVGWYWDPLYCCVKWSYCRSGVRLRPIVLPREVSLLHDWGQTENHCTAAWSESIGGVGWDRPTALLSQMVLLSRLCLNIFEGTLSSNSDIDHCHH
jgi:hypothetical protein